MLQISSLPFYCPHIPRAAFHFGMICVCLYCPLTLLSLLLLRIPPPPAHFFLGMICLCQPSSFPLPSTCLGGLVPVQCNWGNHCTAQVSLGNPTPSLLLLHGDLSLSIFLFSSFTHLPFRELFQASVTGVTTVLSICCLSLH